MASIAHAGETVTAYLFSDPINLGNYRVAADGAIQVTIPASASIGDHRVAVYQQDGTIIGWDAITLAKPAGATATGSTPAASAPGGLDFTGSASSGLAVGAVLLVLAGAVMIGAARRRVQTM